jgi:hypothetical protein
MATPYETIGRMRQLDEDLQSAQTEETRLRDELSFVQAGYAKIEGLKQDVSVHMETLGLSKPQETGSWRGGVCDRAASVFSDSEQLVRSYYYALDALADDIIDSERRIKNRIDECRGNANIFMQSLRWLTGEWSKNLNTNPYMPHNPYYYKYLN